MPRATTQISDESISTHTQMSSSFCTPAEEGPHFHLHSRCHTLPKEQETQFKTQWVLMEANQVPGHKPLLLHTSAQLAMSAQLGWNRWWSCLSRGHWRRLHNPCSQSTIAGAATAGPVPAGMVVAGGGAYLAAAWATIVVFFFSTSTNCFIRSFNDIRSLFDSS